MHIPREYLITTLIISDQHDWRETRGKWLQIRTGAGGTVTLAKSFFWPQPMAPWTAGTYSSATESPVKHDVPPPTLQHIPVLWSTGSVRSTSADKETSSLLNLFIISFHI